MKRITIIFAVASLLCACNKELVSDQSSGLMTIDFNTSDVESATRGTLVNQGGLTSYTDTVDLYVCKNNARESLAPTGAKWQSSSWRVKDYYWASGVTLDIFGIAYKRDASGFTVGTVTYNDSDNQHISFNYTLNASLPSSTNLDLMVGHRRQSSTDSRNVGLQLRHALAAVEFKTGPSILPMTIRRIELLNMDGNKTCHYDETHIESSTPAPIYWVDITGVSMSSSQYLDGLSINVPSTNPDNIDIAVGDNTFIVIPQSGAGPSVKLTCTPSGGTEITATCAITPDWKPGKKYTYKLNYNNGVLSVSSIDVESWADGTTSTLSLN